MMSFSINKKYMFKNFESELQWCFPDTCYWYKFIENQTWKCHIYAKRSGKHA